MSEYDGKSEEELTKIVSSFKARIQAAYQQRQKARDEGVKLNRMRDKAVAALNMIRLRRDNPDLDINLK